MQYRDQLEELNMLTGRIHALSDAVEAKGFYPSGGAELGNAIETAVKLKTPGVVMVPINNWAAFGGTKDVIIWLPIDMIAQTITGLVALRKQIIEDIYQIMGLVRHYARCHRPAGNARRAATQDPVRLLEDP